MPKHKNYAWKILLVEEDREEYTGIRSGGDKEIIDLKPEPNLKRLNQMKRLQVKKKKAKFNLKLKALSWEGDEMIETVQKKRVL
ncbi:unnamed protein product [Eruca vesicaria subsp. sativa]|uniref:Uncharacterized protein n=1 Tax=Eruca vesicaria subsp. sativa TaxID=29727 RepID=A0ABC8IV77_ERUVS|nr:unnamed protein product [Eruca vesicaria subsp. sativa]